MDEQVRQLNERLTRIERQLSGLTNDPRQIKVIQNAIKGSGLQIIDLEIDGALNHDGTLVGFYGTDPIAQQTAVTKPSGGATIDTEARTAIDDIIDIIDNLGLAA